MKLTTIEQTQPINICRSDWRRLPANLKSMIGGEPRILARRNSQSAFVPVRIV